MTRTARVLPVLIALSLVGCSWLPGQERHLKQRYAGNEYPVNTIPGLKTVGVIVIDACTQYHPDLATLTSALHSQLQSVEGLEVVPDAAILNAVPAAQAALATGEKRDFVLPRDGLALADAASVDGVFLAIVTDYNPYGEPVIAIGLVLFSRAMAPMRPGDMDKIVQGGRPLDLPDSPATSPVTAVFDVYDASQKTTRRHIELYAAGQISTEAGVGWERYYRSMPNFMRFVTYEIVWKLFTDLEFQRASATKKPG